ncbi:putative transcription initiation factor TFIIE, beta subunit [Viridothelium virens]|uniref:Transcription initiation factor IIE subunit beta n=1 Tax=Viridothelium virens TaxID=1048519 RepID=A0A6A6HMJ1_VIRVR|nr:putative transcription initiation factor TFIIE, beta subunit [Viridothelium virens]
MATRIKTEPATSSPIPSSAPSSQNDLKRKRPDPPPTTYAQTADPANGGNVMALAVYAVKYLKEKEKALTFDDIYRFLSVPPQLNTDSVRRDLRNHLKTNPRVDYIPKGFDGKGAFTYRPLHPVHSADELKGYLQARPTAQGISVKELKEGWSAVPTAIDELEAKGELLVTRNKKDGAPKHVWPDDPSLAQHVEQEFRQLWHKMELPPNVSEMRAELERAGLTPTSQIKQPVAQKKQKEKKKRAPRSGGRTTNVHMTAVLKDYSNRKK